MLFRSTAMPANMPANMPFNAPQAIPAAAPVAAPVAIPPIEPVPEPLLSSDVAETYAASARNRSRNTSSSIFAAAETTSEQPPARPRTPSGRVGSMGASVYAQTLGRAPADVGAVSRAQRESLLAYRARNTASTAFADAAQHPRAGPEELAVPSRRCAPMQPAELTDYVAHTARAHAAATVALAANRDRSYSSASIAEVLAPGPRYAAARPLTAPQQQQQQQQQQRPTSTQRAARECLDRGVVLGFAALPASPAPATYR